MKKCSTFIVTKEMQIKTILRFHLTSQLEWLYSRAITATNAGNDKGNRNNFTLSMGMQISATIMESSMEIPQKAKDSTAI
jgi:hypothetical protein